MTRRPLSADLRTGHVPVQASESRAGGAPRFVAGELMPPEEANEALAAFWSQRSAAPGFGGDDLETRTFTDAEAGYLTGGAELTAAGQFVSAANALTISTVFACCRVLAEDVAKMDRQLKVRVTRQGKQATNDVVEHPLVPILRSRPNTWMTGFEFWEFMVFHAALTGMSAAVIVRDPDSGRVLELLPLRAGAISPNISASGWDVTYQVSGYSMSTTFRPGDILVLRGPMASEVMTYNPALLAREAIGLSMALQGMQSRFHRNDLRPSGILKVDMKTTSDQAKNRELLERIRDDWQRVYGPGGEGGIAVLDKDFEWTSITANSTDSQTLESRRYQVEEICRFFRVSPQKVMHQSNAGSYGSVEQANIHHVADTLMPWVKRCEEACNRDLLDPDDNLERDMFVNFDEFALARGTLADRMNAYDRMTKLGWTPNEIRVLEGWDPLPYPEMDRPQLLANNTGLQPTPSGSEPRPEQEETARTPLPKPAAYTDPPPPPGHPASNGVIGGTGLPALSRLPLPRPPS